MMNGFPEMKIYFDSPSPDSEGRGWGGSFENLEHRFFNPKQEYYTYDDFKAATKEWTDQYGVTEGRRRFQRELEALMQIEGVGKSGAFQRYMEDKADEAAAQVEEGVEEAEEEAETAMEEAMRKRQSRRKSILTSTYGLLQPAPTRKKRLLGA